MLSIFGKMTSFLKVVVALETCHSSSLPCHVGSDSSLTPQSAACVLNLKMETPGEENRAVVDTARLSVATGPLHIMLALRNRDAFVSKLFEANSLRVERAQQQDMARILVARQVH